MCAHSNNIMPIVSKIFCSPSQVTFIVRKRPRVVNGGGFAVMNFSQKVLFYVDGCGILGTGDELMVRDGDGAPILFIRKKGGIVQALSINNQWKGYIMDYEGIGSSIFSIKEPKACLGRNGGIKISIGTTGEEWEVKGSFVGRSCTVVDRKGKVVAQVGVKEMEQMMAGNDLYYVLVQPGYDQAFIVGVIAVLDNIHGESTRC